MEQEGTIDKYLKNPDIKSALNVEEFCKYRIDEVLMLTETLKESPFRGQAFQRLPKHMRRRQMSHHIKRLPRKLRTSSIISIQDDGSGLPKRPSRKYRRRPTNLLLEYNRRQHKSIWLETHIWHARRFHMTSKWGYRLPEKPTNKSFRACYRAVTNHCFISDISYYNIIELNGQENILLNGLQQCVSTNCGLTFAAKMFKSGSREGFVTMYHPNSYPYSVIGEVSFLWRPMETENENRTIWICVHPASYNEITDLFKTLFNLGENVQEETNDKEISHVEEQECIVKKPVKIESSLSAREMFFHKIPEFRDKGRLVTMKLLRNKLNRFRLTGPLSLAVISNAFDVVESSAMEQEISYLETKEIKLEERNVQSERKRSHSQISYDECDENTKRMKMDEIICDDVEFESTNFSFSCWNKLWKNDTWKIYLENQAYFYKSLANFQTPGDLPSGMVLSLVVKDPRLTIPSKRMKCTPNTKDVDKTILTSPDPSLCHGPLWETDLLEEICNNKISTMEINRMRSRLIVPGSDVGCILKPNQIAKVPLIIIQRSSMGAVKPLDKHDFGCGFDVIVPIGWAMPVWLSLIYRGARPGGLRETESMTLESKNLCELIQPDSRAGESENMERYNRLKSIYFKRPPCKRPNYAKIGVESPFYFPWKALVKDWCRTSSESSEFYVLRDLKKLCELNELLRNAMSKKQKNTIDYIDSFELNDMNCLVPISVESCGKGAPKQNAMLCLPTVEDVKEFESKKVCPVETQHVDPNFKKRKILKSEHVKIVKSLKAKRRKLKLKKAERQDFQSSENEKKSDDEKKLDSKDIVYKYNKEMERLWLKEPENIDTVIKSCSKTLLGSVVLGGFSFSQAQGMGLGYITLNGLLTLLKISCNENIPPLVLFRNNNFTKYRFCKIYICTNKKY